MRNLCGYFTKDYGGWILPPRLDVIQKLKRLKLPTSPEVVALEEELQIKHNELNEAKLDGSTSVEYMPIKTKPFAHQQVAYKIGTELDAAALLMEQGTGKTLTAIAIAGKRMLDDGIQFVLIACPAVVVPVWGKEFAEHADFPHKVIPVIESNATRKIDLVHNSSLGAKPGELMVFVCNFESLWRIEGVFEPLVKEQMIIIDESQRIKSPGAEQSKCLHRLGKLSKYRLILSGTPVTQSPMDIYSQYKFLEPSLFGKSFTNFRTKYAVMGGFEGRQVIAYRNLDELMSKAHSIAYRITKAEALDLPSETTSLRPVTLPPKVQKMYQQLKRESIVELEEQAKGEKIVAVNVLTKLLRLQQLTGGYVNSDGGTYQLHKEKLDALRDELDLLLSDENRKVVIFARFLQEIKGIEEVLHGLKIDYRCITGAVDQTERGLAVTEFQNDKDVRVFVAQIATAGLGITLTAADTAIFYSMDFSLANHEQAKARIHRIGQRHPVTYMYLIAEGTVDAKIFEALKSKKSIADLVVDDWRSVI